MSAAEQSDGWIEWAGGECPLPDGTEHEVRFRDGEVCPDDMPETWDWGNDGHASNIIAYRVIEP